MKKKKILVTGGAGYIGSHAVKALLEQGYGVVVFDNLFRGFKEAIDVLKKNFSRLKFYQGDLRNYTDVAQVFKKEPIKEVMHFAALCLVSESMEKLGEYFENNVLGTSNLLKAMARFNVDKLIFSSTCAVYGESQYLPVDEKHPTNPNSPYGESKLMAEKEIYWFGQLKDLKYVILRYFNVTGASSDGLIGDSKKPSQLLVQNAVRGALNIEPFQLTCPKVDTADGTPIRDYLNVEDLAAAHLKALDYLARGGRSDIFNLGTGQGNSVLEIINSVQKITKVKFPVSKGETRRGEYAQVYADISKAKKALKWEPRKTITDSILSLVKWYKNRPNGWSY